MRQMGKHKASREMGFIYKPLEDGHEQWAGRFNPILTWKRNLAQRGRGALAG